MITSYFTITSENQLKSNINNIIFTFTIQKSIFMYISSPNTIIVR